MVDAYSLSFFGYDRLEPTKVIKVEGDVLEVAVQMLASTRAQLAEHKRALSLTRSAH